ncbi:MAG: nucleotidyltransferase domain-containing protein, partial [Gammaproteobacteria bacterium]|nr:nucleotidyltransferase domain-containing protein [Gammaproteobacteria bacterium]
MTFTPVWPEAITATAAWRQQLLDFNQWSKEQFLHADIETLVSARAEFFDQLLRALWERCEFNPATTALLAVGGYGRGTLHPESDIDLLFLIAEELPADDQQRISQFITLLWDLRVQVGHAVRTIDDCFTHAAKDITIATSLIEHRLLAGSEPLTQR